MDAQEPSTDERMTLMTVQEVAVLLRCSARTVYRLADTGKLPPPCRLGGLVRWSAPAVRAWVTAGCPASRPLHQRNLRARRQ